MYESRAVISGEVRSKSSFTVSVTLLIARTPQLFTCVRSIEMAELMFVWLRQRTKSRVAPLKKQSIPRLESLGAVLFARLVHKSSSAVQQLKTINWTDLMTTLCWIKNERVWKQYVRHRVDQIRNLSSKDDL